MRMHVCVHVSVHVCGVHLRLFHYGGVEARGHAEVSPRLLHLPHLYIDTHMHTLLTLTHIHVHIYILTDIDVHIHT